MSLNKLHLDELLKKLTLRMPLAIIGGSLMLRYRGLINREPNDVDVLIPNYLSITKFLERLPGVELATDMSSLSDVSTDVFGNKIQRTACMYKDIKICVFKVPVEQMVYDYENKYSHSAGHHLYIRIQRPMFAIEAKRQYVSNSKAHTPYMKKHVQDLMDIAINMGMMDAYALLKDEHSVLPF
jgi:hypothetical protein